MGRNTQAAHVPRRDKADPPEVCYIGALLHQVEVPMEALIGHRHRLVAEMLGDLLLRHGIATSARTTTTGIEAERLLCEMPGGLAVLDMRLSRAAPTTFLPLEPWRHAKAALILLVEPNSCLPPTVPQLLLRHVRGAVVGTDAGLREFLASVDAAVRADQVPSPALRAAASEEGRGAMRRLSRRERQVLQMVAEGLTSKEIAVEMGLSAKTVARHRENLREKLGGGIADLTRLAVRLGLVEP